MSTEIVRAAPEHIQTIADRMREDDRREVEAMNDSTPAEALTFSLRKSSRAWTVVMDGQPEVMFGVGDINILAGVGAPWLLGTDAVLAHQVEFLRGSREWISQLLRRYSVLRNFVDARNAASIRWLRWLGFSISDPIMHRGHAFHMFELRATDVRNSGYPRNPDHRVNPARGGGHDTAGASGV
jgi:hypothetical protein